MPVVDAVEVDEPRVGGESAEHSPADTTWQVKALESKEERRNRRRSRRSRSRSKDKRGGEAADTAKAEADEEAAAAAAPAASAAPETSTEPEAAPSPASAGASAASADHQAPIEVGDVEVEEDSTEAMEAPASVAASDPPEDAQAEDGSGDSGLAAAWAAASSITTDAEAESTGTAWASALADPDYLTPEPSEAQRLWFSAGTFLAEELAAKQAQFATEVADKSTALAEADDLDEEPMVRSPFTPRFAPDGDPPPILNGVEIVRELARGGFGTVWLGVLQDGDNCAVKGFGDMDDIRIGREIGITTFFGGAWTDYFLKVIDWQVDKAGETPAVYMIQELAVGDLRASVIEKPFFEIPLVARLELARQALEGIAIINENGFVHKDIKPDNLLLALDAAGNIRVKIADFGFAVSLTEDAPEGLGPMDDDYLGVVPFMSPESFRRAVSLKSDVYSMAIVLYEMVFGQVPPLVEAADRLFKRNIPGSEPYVGVLVSGLDLERDEFFRATVEANKIDQLPALDRFLSLLRKMHAYDEEDRIDAATAAWEMGEILNMREDWDQVEALILAARAVALEACTDVAGVSSS